MSSFKYVGDPNDRFGGPDIAVHFGKTFRKNEVVDLGDEDKAVAAKLAGHSHFVDMSDNEAAAKVEDRKAALEQAEADKAAAIEEQRKQDKEDEAERARLAAENPVSPAATVPRPPGKVTRDPPGEAFGGRTVEERTQAEDHTKAGKTKG